MPRKCGKPSLQPGRIRAQEIDTAVFLWETLGLEYGDLKVEAKVAFLRLGHYKSENELDR